MLVRLSRKIRKAFAGRITPSPAEAWCAQHLAAAKVSAAESGSPVVVVECAEDLFFYVLHGEIAVQLCKQGAFRISRWASKSFGVGEYSSWRAYVIGRLNLWLLSRGRWAKLYNAYCDLPGGRADRLRAPWREVAWWWRAWRLFRNLSSKDQLAALTSGGIRIGDLVIDSYLRFRPSAEVKLGDRYLITVLRQALKDIDSSRAYFRKEKPILYLSSYATYVNHGVPARVAADLGIKTLTFANVQQFSTEITPQHQFHTKPCDRYAAEFEQLPDRAAKIAQAAEILGRRVAGIPDTATANQRSAYETRTSEVPDVRGTAVVFLHDFFDSAHIYNWMVFHDFWEWSCATIDALLESGRPFFLKPHPNQRAESLVELQKLKDKYPGIRFLAPEVSNRQLVDGGMACAVTVYGSVASEMGYLGLPSISCGDNPHASFDAFGIAKSKQEYRALLRDFHKLPRDAEKLRYQACAFYYMHYLNINPEALDLRDRMIVFYLALIEAENQTGAFDRRELSEAFASLESAAGFRQFIEKLAAG